MSDQAPARFRFFGESGLLENEPTAPAEQARKERTDELWVTQRADADRLEKLCSSTKDEAELCRGVFELCSIEHQARKLTDTNRHTHLPSLLPAHALRRAAEAQQHRRHQHRRRGDGRTRRGPVGGRRHCYDCYEHAPLPFVEA